jgi:hypothetical protein
MKRKRGPKPAGKNAGPTESTSLDLCPVLARRCWSLRDQAEVDNNAPPVVDVGLAVLEPLPPPPAPAQPPEPKPGVGGARVLRWC